MNAGTNDITYAFPKLEHVDPSVYIDAYNLILECSQAHSPRSFAIKLLDLMSKMCSYDEAMVFPGCEQENLRKVHHTYPGQMA